MNILKSWIHKKFFHSEEYLLSFYEKMAEKNGSMVGDLQRENRRYKEYIKVMNHIFSSGYAIIGIEKNKNGKELFVVKNMYDDTLDIYLYSPYYNHPHPYLYGIINRDTDNQTIDLEIADIQSIDNSIGHGTIMLKYLIKIAKESKFTSIHGYLSAIDEKNFSRSIPYYKKFGFEIKLNEEKRSGIIKLQLEQ